MNKGYSVLLKISKVLLIILLAILSVSLGVVTYFRQSWKQLTYSELLFHLKTSITGTDPAMIISAVLKYGVPTLVLFIAIIFILGRLEKRNAKVYCVAVALAIVILVALNGISLYVYNLTTNVVSDFVNALTGKKGSDFVENNYKDTFDVSLTFPEKKRNLIYIYLESMEMTFSDKASGGAYAENYIPRLTELSNENDNFSGDDNILEGGVVLPGTNWTSAALFAQTSGLPLELPFDESAAIGEDQFFPTIRTLGDILKDEGYTNVVEMGSEADFGGLKVYYENHGDYIIHDYDYALEDGLIPKDYHEFWGYEDEKLFQFAREEITELAAKDEPFNYTMFTMDTHAEAGYVCRLCGKEFGDDQYANVIACSDRQVTDFVKWIQEQDFYDNTTVVITGDHNTMVTDFVENIDADYLRRTYTCILNSAVKPAENKHRKYSTIDLYPTILASLGVQMSSNQLGCGVNLYSTEPTLIEEYGVEKCVSEFAKGSKFVEELVQVSVGEDDLRNAQENAYIEVADEDGMIRFRLNLADAINYTEIKDLSLVVFDKTTGKKHKYEMEIKRTRAGWHGIVHSDIPFANVLFVNCEVYVSVDDFDDYFLISAEPDDFEVWDVRWDVD